MAFRTPAVIQNENLPIHRGKGIDGAKVDIPKPAKTGRQERKALRDLSQPPASKPLISFVSKGSTIKDKSAARGHEATKSASKTNILTDEELQRCHAWAKEGIEECHFTGNDLQKLQSHQQEERVKKKVQKAMSALRQWTDMSYNLATPVKEIVLDTDEVLKLELEPEVLPPITLRSNSGDEEIERLIDDELDNFLNGDLMFDFKLKEDFDSDGACLWCCR